MYFSGLQKANVQIKDLDELRIVVAGGTQGIGAGIALRFAVAGASVWVIGRDKQRGEEIVAKLQQANRQGDYKFFQADLSNVQEIKRVADAVRNYAGKSGFDWLFASQGGPPTGNAPETPSGIDSAFAVQCLSRYGLAKQLLASQTVSQGVCFFAMPGQGGGRPLDLADIELKKSKSRFGLNMMRCAARDSAITDAMTMSFAEKYPSKTFTHLFPGVVATNGAANAGFPFPFPQMMSIAKYLVPSAAQFAEVPFYLHANPEGRALLHQGQPNLLTPWLGRLSLSKNVEDRAHRNAILAALDNYGV